MLPVIQLDKPTVPKPRRSLTRLSLRWFLVIIAVLPLTIGMYVRREMTRVRGYHAAELEIKRPTGELFRAHEAYAGWRVDGLGRETLTYLIVVPPGDSGRSGPGPGFYEAPITRGPLWQFLTVDPDHIYCGQKQLSNDRYPTAWLYLTSSEWKETEPGEFHEQQVQVQLLEIPRAELNISREEFARLQETDLWKKYLLPAAEAEGARWLQQHNKRSGLSD